MERRDDVDEDEDEFVDEAARAAAVVPQRNHWLPDEDLALIRAFVHVRVHAILTQLVLIQV
jgi:hypothetical protein